MLCCANITFSYSITTKDGSWGYPDWIMERRNFPVPGPDVCCPERTVYKMNKHVIGAVHYCP